MLESTVKSTIEYPKVISGKVDLSIAVTGNGQSFTIEEAFTSTVPYRVFYTVDDKEILMSTPVYIYDAASSGGKHSNYITLISGLQVRTIFSISVDGVTTDEYTNALIISVLNTSSSAHTIHLEYFIYYNNPANA